MPESMTRGEAYEWLKTTQATVQFGMFKGPSGKPVVRAFIGSHDGRGPEMEDAVSALRAQVEAAKKVERGI